MRPLTDGWEHIQALQPTGQATDLTLEGQPPAWFSALQVGAPETW